MIEILFFNLKKYICSKDLKNQNNEIQSKIDFPIEVEINSIVWKKDM